MATLAMPSPRISPARTPRDASPREIIESARMAPAGMRGALMASCLTAVAMWGAFTPVDFGPLAWVCLVPLLSLVRLPRPTHRMYRAAFLGGMLFWTMSLQWMRLGHPTMYLALLALSFYLALYFPLFLGLTRVAVWQLRIPLTIAAPIIWTGLELLRGHLMTGFSWYYLGHTQYRWIDLIQIADVVGTYGISFLTALVAACITEIVPISWIERLRLLPVTSDVSMPRTLTTAGRWWRAVCCLGLVGAAVGYGHWRRAGIEFQSGPRVALIQSNVTSDVKHNQHDWQKIQRQLEMLTGLSVKQQPDLIVWPETMFRWPLLETPLDVSDADLEAAHPKLPLSWLRDLQVRRKLAQLSQMAGAGMVIGLETLSVDREKIRTYNSAAFIRPDGMLAGRYDKLHRVAFGEYIPLGDTFPWLRNFTPFGPDFGIEAGTACSVFEYQGYRFAPIICFEDTVPQLVRNIVNVTTVPTERGPKKVDFLVNMTNDGWFHGSSELDQHLITAAFRCVECRTPMVRSVNTGISAFIDGDGVIRRRAEGLRTKNSKQEEAVVVDHIALDTRESLYLAGGDWFAGTCLICCAGLLPQALWTKWRKRRSGSPA
jgi:apolipoprotein N-acyltransferase